MLGHKRIPSRDGGIEILVEELATRMVTLSHEGYVGLSIATLLSQNNDVIAADIIPEKVELINNRKSPNQDDYIENTWQIKS